jgi:hypothetical protein
MNIHTAKPLVPEHLLSELEIAIIKLNSYISLSTDQIPTSLIKASGEALSSEIHKAISSVLNKEELPQKCKESIFQVHKLSDKTDYNNYPAISLLFISYDVLPNILLASLFPYANEIIWDHLCGFLLDISTTDQIFKFAKYWRKWEYI